MASPARPPAPPSFYSNVASMGGGTGAGSKPPADDKKKMGGEDEAKIVKLLHKLFEQWQEMVGSDKDKAGLVQQMSGLLDQYDTKFMKGAGKEGKESTPPSSTEGAGPAPGAAAGSAGGAGGEAQPVPA